MPGDTFIGKVPSSTAEISYIWSGAEIKGSQIYVINCGSLYY
jgi:hypothetical protein